MKKQEIYTPQFEIEDIDTDIEKVACVHCGKTVKKSLTNLDGICIECVMNNKVNTNNPYSAPNEKLFLFFVQEYKQYLKKKPKNNLFVGIAGATVGLLGAAAVSYANQLSRPSDPNSKFEYVNQKIKPSHFDKFNKTTVYIKDESWVCPCCSSDNFGAHFCKTCGVYPNFKLLG